MPRYKTSQEWLDQSSLLLQARPTTTRITTRYSMKPAKTKNSTAKDDDTPMSDPKPPRGFLVLKTYDPISGVTLKYRTTKAAEVSRLIHALGKLGRIMAALPEEASPAGRDEDMADMPGKEAEGTSTPVEGAKSEGKPAATSSKQAQGGGGGGKKKKGKK